MRTYFKMLNRRIESDLKLLTGMIFLPGFHLICDLIFDSSEETKMPESPLNKGKSSILSSVNSVVWKGCFPYLVQF